MIRALFTSLSILFSTTAFAQLIPREQHAVRGSYAVTGNAMVDCPTVTPCDNNSTILVPVDVDPLALGDLDGDGEDDTTVSTSATLSLPPAAEVRSATLLVLAFGSETEAGGAQWLPSMDPLEYPILIAAPGGDYVRVQAAAVRTGQGLIGGGYEAEYDVTSLVRTSGEYWVADAVLAPPERPFNQNAGWTLVVTYEDGSRRSSSPCIRAASSASATRRPRHSIGSARRPREHRAR